METLQPNQEPQTSWLHRNPFSATAFAILLIAIVAALVWYFTEPASAPTNNGAQNSCLVGTPEEECNDVVNNNQQLSYKFLDKQTNQFLDQELVAIDSNNQQQVLVSSIREKSFGKYFWFINDQPVNNKLILVAIIPSSDAPPQGLFTYDLAAGTFTEMKTSPLYKGFGAKAVSFDSLFIATVQESQQTKLYLLDLGQDTSKVLATLKGNETFNYCASGCFADIGSEIVWNSNDSVEVSVFDKTKIEAADWGGTKYKFIDKRTYNVK